MQIYINKNRQNFIFFKILNPIWLALFWIPNFYGQSPELVVQTAPSSEVKSVAIDSTSRILATGGKEVIIWDLETKKMLRTIESPDFYGAVKVAFDLKGTLVTTNAEEEKYDSKGNLLNPSRGNVVKLWNVMTGKEVGKLRNSIDLISVSPNGKFLTFLENGIVSVQDLISGKTLANLQTKANIKSISVNSNGDKLVFFSESKVVLWDIKLNKKLAEFTDLGSPVLSLAFSPDNNFIAVGNTDGIDILNLESKTKSHLPDYDNTAWSAVFSPDGKYLVAGVYGTGGKHDYVKFWDLKNGLKMSSLSDQISVATSCRFSPSGNLFAITDNDHKVKILNIETGKVTVLFDEMAAVSLVFSPDETIIGTADGHGSEIRFRNTKTGAKINYKDIPKWASNLDDLRIDWDSHTYNGNKFTAYPENSKLLKIKKLIGQEEVAVASLIFGENDDWAVVTPDGLFDGSGSLFNQMYWRIDNDIFKTVPLKTYYQEHYRPGLLKSIVKAHQD